MESAIFTFPHIQTRLKSAHKTFDGHCSAWLKVPIVPPEQERRTQAILLMAEDELRQRIIELSPQISEDVRVMANIIRELVNTEREKKRLGKIGGSISLYPHKTKKFPQEPDLIGKGYVTGRPYRAAAWIQPDKLKVSLLPDIQK